MAKKKAAKAKGRGARTSKPARRPVTRAAAAEQRSAPQAQMHR